MGFFDKIKSGLTKTRDQIKTKIEWIVQGKPIEEGAFDEIEEALILADAGLPTAELLVSALKEKWKRGYIKTMEDIKASMKEEVQKLLTPIEAPMSVNNNKPFVILTLGVNGVGKTTTIAKLGSIYLSERKKVLFGACDTFRAAAIEQLDIWAKRINVEMVRHADGSDPAAVAFDTVKAAKSRGTDIVILDTAGRLHTKANLIEEMKKIDRVISKEVEDAPHEVLLVVDATNGERNSTGKAFNEAVDDRDRHYKTRRDRERRLHSSHCPSSENTGAVHRRRENIDDLIPFNAKESPKRCSINR